ncbi:MAG: hypothetical protein IJY92_01925 [Alphaproteobacteria bacterium]|nr:hypothetical protein [Alphaproteobacteria bacterium]
MTDPNRQRPSNPQQNPPAQGVRRPAQSSQGTGQVPPQGARRPVNPARMAPQAGQRPMTRPVQSAPMSRPATGAAQQGRPTHMVQRAPVQGQQPYRYQQTQMGQSAVRQSTPQQMQQSASPQLTNPKTMGILTVGALLFGILLGAMMFSGSSAPAPQGLQGVVRNDDIRVKLPRCGRIDRGQACILYLMNSTRYDRIAESFFEEALRLTEVPIYSISMANPKYAKRRIPPGAFAEIHIPKVR